MILKLHPKLKNGYAVSVVLHLIIFLILALIFVKPVLPVKWHQFEWEFPLKEASDDSPAAKGVTQTPAPVKAEIATSSPAVVSAPQAETTEQRITETPILETPSIETSTPSKVTVPRSRARSGLLDVGKNLPGGNFGFSANMEQGSGEAYIISQPKPNIIPNEEGEVFLEFKLTGRGDVDLNSVVVLSYTNAAYVEAVQKALRSWRFGFRGAYNPDKKYRIRCKFVINED